MITRSGRVTAIFWVIALVLFVPAQAEAQHFAQEKLLPPKQSELEGATVEERLEILENELRELKAEKERQKAEEDKLRTELEREKKELKSLEGTVKEIPRTIHENGPPGYVRRRYLDESPANPTFRSTTIFEPKEPETREEKKKKFVTAGSFPHSILIPGTDTSIGLSGFIRLNVLYSLDPVGDDRQFATATIPVPQQSGTSTNFDFSWSRLTLETHTKNEKVDDVKTFLQTDFFGTNNTLRVRWAYVDFSYFRAGQAASVFMDYDMWPNVIDPEGPDAMLLKRHPLVQLTVPLNHQLKFALGAEDPDGSITVPMTATGSPVGTATNKIPDFASHLRYDYNNGHVQVSGLVRKLTFRMPAGAENNAVGYGAHFSADIHPWAVLMGKVAANPDPTPLEKSRLMAQVAIGRGFSTYLEDAASGLDAAVDAAGNLKALPITIWTVAYEHWWARSWTSTLSYGQFDISGISTMPGSSQVGSRNFMGNLIWLPMTNMWVGMEFQWGKRRDLDGQNGEAKRIMWGIHYAY
jgi:hypothetical protein